ncbi:hypothetical protein BMS3Bbin16_00664 [archaeon BMS3Bbin16]|nr:hypothetical protein BMS3Bbin16_00664 [archaeon BMS3Bbin16]
MNRSYFFNARSRDALILDNVNAFLQVFLRCLPGAFIIKEKVKRILIRMVGIDAVGCKTAAPLIITGLHHTAHRGDGCAVDLLAILIYESA